MSERHVFIVGSKGIPASYGGFESFVDKLTQYRKHENIHYHVACAVDKGSELAYTEFEYNGAHCFNIPWRNDGSSRAVFYDVDAINYCIKYIKDNDIKDPIVYILACRIGIYVKKLVKQIHDLGGTVFVNPDGHEWKRSKWNAFIRHYWKVSERLMVKNADFLVCDSKEIERYIKADYSRYSPKTTFIAYGSETSKSVLEDNDDKVTAWYKQFNVEPKNYYLVVGRFVPENNYETMVREFMKSDTTRDFVIITNNDGNPFYDKLKETTAFDRDSRIKFVGTVYDQELLKKIRENAYAYFHGHEVGGTNPSLLEALGSTDLNLLLDVAFNREVGGNGAIYWNKEPGNLAGVINETDKLDEAKISEIGIKARKRIEDDYTWDYIVDRYETLFIEGIN